MKYFWLGLFIVGTLFSFGMSLVPGEKSAKISDQIAQPVIDVITNPDKPITEQEEARTRFLTRKVIGHFLLNAGIGFCGFISFYLITKKRHLTLFIMLLTGFFIAGFSEVLQFIPESRYPSWNDVLINFTGIISAIIFLYLFGLLFKGKKHDRLSRIN